MTTAGANQLLALAAGEAVTNFATANCWQGVGGGAGATTAFAITQTDLLGASKARKPVTSSTRSGNVLTTVATWAAADAVFTWDEFSVAFNSATVGTMLARAVSTGFFVKNASTTATLTATLTITAA